MSVNGYLSGVVAPIVKVLLCSSVIPLALELFLSDGVVRFFVVSAAAVLLTAASIYFLGMSESERAGIVKIINEKLGRRA